VRLFDGETTRPLSASSSHAFDSKALNRKSKEFEQSPVAEPCVAPRTFITVNLLSPFVTLLARAPKEDKVEQSSEEEEESDADTDFGDDINAEFVDPLTPDIMAHLLSKEVRNFGGDEFDEDSTEDASGEGEDDSEDEEEYHGPHAPFVPVLSPHDITVSSLLR